MFHWPEAHSVAAGCGPILLGLARKSVEFVVDGRARGKRVIVPRMLQELQRRGQKEELARKIHAIAALRFVLVRAS